MTPSRPYFLRAVYDWIVDNSLTPYIVIDILHPYVEVPLGYAEDNKIILNISPDAVSDLVINNEVLQFSASFSGEVFCIFAPIGAVQAVYAQENGRGMVFKAEDMEGADQGGSEPPPPPQRPKMKPKLHIVK